MLSAASKKDQSALIFSGVFVIVWCGAGIITVNSKLLGSNLYAFHLSAASSFLSSLTFFCPGNSSFFQSVCVLGYCIFPLVCAEVVTLFVHIFVVNLVVVILAFIWSTYGIPLPLALNPLSLPHQTFTLISFLAPL